MNEYDEYKQQMMNEWFSISMQLTRNNCPELQARKEHLEYILQNEYGVEVRRRR